jgi:hypothetical protein
MGDIPFNTKGIEKPFLTLLKELHIFKYLLKTQREILAISITSDEVNELFSIDTIHLAALSRPIQPLTEMSTRKLPSGKARPARKADLTTFREPAV